MLNENRFSISAMCRTLKVPKSSFYYKSRAKVSSINSILESAVVKIFRESKNNYGTRKLKVELKKLDFIVSRRKIGKFMAKNCLLSNYTIKQYKKHVKGSNEALTENLVNRNFDNRAELEVVVSDLTYVNVNGKWNYVCLIIDLYNREIIGHCAGKVKDANLVYKALLSVKYNLGKISIFHSDRGNEFKNQSIDACLEAFKIKRSLSRKGNPYDNSVAEATYKIFKTEFTFNRKFQSFEQLETELFDYVNWFNNKRIHSTLGYLTPLEFKQQGIRAIGVR
jgi:putative transposase